MKVFLGGTCNESKWRDELIKKLEIEYFNPVVDDWTPECMAEEIKQRKICDYVLYTITPKMTGAYGIAEAVDDSNKQPFKTLFCVLKSVVFIYKYLSLISLNSIHLPNNPSFEIVGAVPPTLIV
jgi:hypothetical protein